MPPRAFTNPAPKTESAREAVRSFYCELCSKGYARMNEFEAHEGSYDHQHKKRLKEMKQMSRDPMASTKARKAERKLDEKSGLISIKPMKIGTSSASSDSKGGGGGISGGGFKKGGFKSAFGGGGATNVEIKVEPSSSAADLSAAPVIGEDAHAQGARGVVAKEEESDTDGEEEYEMYDPRKPTDCFEGCACPALVETGAVSMTV